MESTWRESIMVDRNSRRRSVGGAELLGLLLVGLGILFLLDQLGWFRFTWGMAWPVALIGLGLVVLYGATRGSGGGATSASVPRDGVDQLELALRVGAGRFVVGGGATTLVEATSTTDDIHLRTDRAGRRAHVRLSRDRPWFPFANGLGASWRVAVADDVPTRLDVSAGAGEFEIDLSTLRIVDVRLAVGAAQTRLTLPRPVGEVPVRMTVGASEVTLVIPAGVEASVRSSGGLLSVEGRTETPGYATAADRVAVRVDGGAASVRIV
jgi:hypothetical protein